LLTCGSHPADGPATIAANLVAQAEAQRDLSSSLVHDVSV